MLISGEPFTLASFIITIFCAWTPLSFVDAAARFTQVPPSKLYVVKGGTAMFFWDYHVGDRLKDFDSASPRWRFYGENFIANIGYDDVFAGWKFQIDTQRCPPRLLIPTVRVSRESNATLVITNVTMADSGIYGCRLFLSSGLSSSMPISKVELIVTDVIPHFSKVPPKILYVPVGQAATLEWDYISSNKSSNFDPQSPRWEFYNSIDGWKTIGADYGTLGWQWKLSSSCPERLQNPTRVTKASVASLVIYNLTTEDSGLYRCNLTLRHRPPITNSTTLIVTAPPHFNRRPSSFVNIQEGRNLQISCSAVGPPTPNVSWVQVQGDSKATIVEGVGSVTLMIPNIKRDQNGTYECQAVNNPNQSPVTTQTTVNIMYPPSIDHSMSDNAITFFPQVVTRLRCVASGFPIPNITWYNSNEQRIKENVTSLPGYSEVSIYIENQKDYKCRAENVLGFIEHEVTVRGYENDAICYKTKIAKDKGGTELGKPFLIAVSVLSIIAIICILITIVLIIKLRRGRSTKKRYSSQKGVINISMDPVPPLSDHGLPYNTEQGEETAYEEPLDEPTVTDTSHNISYPYEIPQISDEMYVNTSDPSAARNYQELNTLEQISRDYQNLQGIRSTVRSPLGLQPEVAYEPLKKAQQPKYEPLNYQ